MARDKSKAEKQLRAWCEHCGRLTPHIASQRTAGAKPGGTCRLCGATHRLSAKPPKEPDSAAPASRPPRSGNAQWEELVDLAGSRKPLQYAMRRTYAEGDLIAHEVFGLGVVIREVNERKIEVSFRDGIRLLARNLRK